MTSERRRTRSTTCEPMETSCSNFNSKRKKRGSSQCSTSVEDCSKKRDSSECSISAEDCSKKRDSSKCTSDNGDVLHRDAEIRQITGVILHHIPFVYICGPAGSGKSFCLDHIIKNVSDSVLNIAQVDMRNIIKVQGFYHSLLTQLTDQTSNIPDHSCDFVRLLNEHVSNTNSVIVIRAAHLLNQLNSLLFLTLTKLHEFTQSKISVVMMSDAPWDLLYLKNGSPLTKPFMLHIRPYSRVQMIDIISVYLRRKCRDTCQELQISDNVVRNYVQSCVYDTLSHYTSSIRDMIKQAVDMFDPYLGPVRAGTLKQTDTTKLFLKLQPTLVQTTTQLSCVSTFKCNLELPYNSRVLLVSAFLASHNPARLDKRFFCKAKSSRRKSRAKGSKLDEKLKGPKTFSFERLVAIYSAITQDGTIPCSDILIAISSLISLNLVVQMSVDQLEQPKYKCIVPLATIKSLAKESAIDFEQYYYNY